MTTSTVKVYTAEQVAEILRCNKVTVYRKPELYNWRKHRSPVQPAHTRTKVRPAVRPAKHPTPVPTVNTAPAKPPAALSVTPTATAPEHR